MSAVAWGAVAVTWLAAAGVVGVSLWQAIASVRARGLDRLTKARLAIIVIGGAIVLVANATFESAKSALR